MGYLYSETITIDHTKVSGGSDLTNFPMLFSITDINLKTTAFGGFVQNSNGFDIIFTNTSDVLLDFEVESYTASSGLFIAWVRIPTLSASVDTVIKLKYDNSAINSSQENASGIWATLYEGVWHLKEDPSGGAPQMGDSTGHGHAGTSQGSMQSSNLITGQIDGALSFTAASSQDIDIPHNASLNLYPLTISSWIKQPGGIANFPAVVGKYTSSSLNGYHIGFEASDSVVAWYYKDNTNNIPSVTGSSIGDNLWHLVQFAVDGTGGEILVDGVSIASTAWTGTPGATTSAQEFYIARYATTGNYYQGSADEVRVSNTRFTNGWLITEFNNQKTPSSFYSLGAATTTSTSSSTSTTTTSTSISTTTTISSTTSRSTSTSISTSSSTTTTSTSLSSSTTVSTSTSSSTSTTTTSTSSSTTTTSTSTTTTNPDMFGMVEFSNRPGTHL